MPTVVHAGGVSTAHLSCLFCVGAGCEDCGGSGMRVTWKVRGRLIGGHYHVSVWAGSAGSRANLGTLIMDETDWAELLEQGKRMHPPMEVEVVDGFPKGDE